MCYIVKFDQSFSLFLGHFSKTWACHWIRQQYMNYIFGMCRATSRDGIFMIFLLHCSFMPICSNLIKVIIAWGISFSFSSCNLQIVQIIFLSLPESLTKSQRNFSFHLLIVESSGTFFFISVKSFSYLWKK